MTYDGWDGRVSLPHIRLYYYKTVRYTSEAKLLTTFTTTIHLLPINNKLLLYQQQRQHNKPNVGAVDWSTIDVAFLDNLLSICWFARITTLNSYNKNRRKVNILGIVANI